MDIAVIIPMYNGAKWIRDTVNSAFRQSHAPSEVIVVDNNSTDSSADIVKAFPGIKLINNPIQGPNFSRQCGLKASNADLIAFLDQDDIWHPDHLKSLAWLLQHHPDCPAAVASSLSFSSSQNLHFPTPASQGTAYNPWDAFPALHIATPSALLIRAKALEAIGGWPTQFSFCGDVNTWLRLSVHHAFIKNEGITVGYRRHPDSQSATSLTQNTQKCFNTLFCSVENALTYYPTESKQARGALTHSQLKRRLAALSAMSHVVYNVSTSQFSTFSQSILRFEESLSEESQAFVGSMCGLFIWILYGHLLNQPFLVSQLLEHWPNEAQRTRKNFELRVASSRILPKSLISEPLNRHLWRILWGASPQIAAKLPLYRK